MSRSHLLAAIWHLPRRMLIGLITVYQATFSPDHGPLKSLYPYGFCPQSPTCSQYAREVIAKRGAILGGALAAWRVLTCNPWNRKLPART